MKQWYISKHTGFAKIYLGLEMKSILIDWEWLLPNLEFLQILKFSVTMSNTYFKTKFFAIKLGFHIVDTNAYCLSGLIKAPGPKSKN